ncbi:MAG: 2-C-methyl-D-erythritol 4-phosphate cytidylyltransferase [Chromatiales bacterium]|nr:2-C-methyl-D-erythritol 4-phosphate cytidylyltransferase [Chromatiales bacterium]
MRFWAVIPAAGIGARMGVDRPKQYLTLAGRTVLEHSIGPLLAHPAIAAAVVAIRQDDPWWPTLTLRNDARVHTCAGGTERADSVRNALRHLLERGAHNDDWVLVHDAARPCLLAEDLERLIETLKDEHIGGLLAVPVTDTVKRAAGDGRVETTLPRTGLWRAATPQMFRFGPLVHALEVATAEGLLVTDESMAMEHMGHRPLLVASSARNLKITHPSDLPIAERYLECSL